VGAFGSAAGFGGVEFDGVMAVEAGAGGGFDGVHSCVHFPLYIMGAKIVQSFY
jgi:hypothetical protein